MMKIFLMIVLHLGLLISGGAATDDRKPLKCRNPSGKLWSSILNKNCGQSVCKKIGKKATWQECPKAATEARIEEVITQVIDKKIEKVTKMQEVMENQLRKLLEKICHDCGEEPLRMTTSEEGSTDITTTSVPLGLDCPEKWLRFGSNCYRFPNGTETEWAQAESNCQRLLAGAHLASIHSVEEQRFVLNNYPIYIWLGGSDLNEEGSWVWTDGSQWDFSAWHTEEPNNAGEGEDCLVHRGEDWNDNGCSDRRGFLCKAPLISGN